MSSRLTSTRFILNCHVILICCFWHGMVGAANADDNQKPGWVRPMAEVTQIMPWQSQRIIELKFREGTSYRLDNGKLISRSSPNELTRLNAVFNQYPIESITPLFSSSASDLADIHSQLQSQTGEQIPDLNGWFRLTVAANTNAADLVNALNALQDVETAYPAALPAPPPATPDLVPEQGYLRPATAGGIDAEYAWLVGGGNGSQVKIVDIEYSFNANHEDLPSITVLGGVIYNGWGDDHGTAVLGELVGKSNTFGVTGIGYGAVAQFVSPCFDVNCNNFSIANAINIARENTAAGDVILLEQQASVCNSSDYGPVEWVQSTYDAIKVATASGRHVVQAAGNGNVNLDKPECGGVFNRANRDSGAMIVGAGAPPDYSQPDRSRLDFSSYGSRVDLQGWGRKVVSTGYGDRYNASYNQRYTSAFSGTSSASPIVAGASAILSSVSKKANLAMPPLMLRDRLVATGSPQQAAPGFPVTENIGPRPNLRAALTCRACLPNRGGWRAILGQ